MDKILSPVSVGRPEASLEAPAFGRSRVTGTVVLCPADPRSRGVDAPVSVGRGMRVAHRQGAGVAPRMPWAHAAQGIPGPVVPRTRVADQCVVRPPRPGCAL